MSERNVYLSTHIVLRYLPAVLVMLAIFLFSSGQAVQMESTLLSRLVNKGGHVIGYGVLAMSYWRIFAFVKGKRWLAWMLAVVYALSDEFHQSFVPGRHPSVLDVLVYDNLGAFLSLWLAGLYLKLKQPATQRPVVDDGFLPAKN